MSKKKKNPYERQSNNRRPAPAGSEVAMERPNLATINLAAGAGQAGLGTGDKVRITAAGLYSGELATIERLTTGVIPSAFVRTASGGTRTVRTIDLVPAKSE